MFENRFKVVAALMAAAAFLLGGDAAYAAKKAPESKAEKAQAVSGPEASSLLTVSTITHQEEGFDASIQIPVLRDLGSADLETRVNARNLEASVALYKSFMSKMAEMKAEGSKNYALTATSRVAAYGNGLLTLEHGRTEVMASSETVVRFETIDLGTGRELALSDLFKDEGYTKLLAQIVTARMKEEMKKDPAKSYALEGGLDVRRDQPFYIENGTLVLVFDQGTVAPYSMGTCTFPIPTEKLKGSLAQQDYLR